MSDICLQYYCNNNLVWNQNVASTSQFLSNMWYAALVRFIRRRLVLGIIFASSLTYCIVSFLKEGSNRNMVYQDIMIEKKPFVWRTLQEHNDTSNFSCRNSVQGKDLIVDDKGYVCNREDMTKGGCCDPQGQSSIRYGCNSCRENNCCISYEYCVSCCLDPSKRDMLQIVLSKLSADENVLFRSLTDDYELCLTKCRTSSHSVLHENSYKDPAYKHCFGSDAPGTRSPD